jgi:1-deoxy-D-xylulose-5-phosphate synthase
MIVSAPMNSLELRNLLYTSQLDKINQPFSIAIREAMHGERLGETICEIEIGKARLISEAEI